MWEMGRWEMGRLIDEEMDGERWIKENGEGNLDQDKMYKNNTNVCCKQFSIIFYLYPQGPPRYLPAR